jgi:hypothetical protein
LAPDLLIISIVNFLSTKAGGASCNWGIEMRNLTCAAFVMAVLIGAGFAAPANADVIYTLTFKNSSNITVGTGTLDLNFTTLSQDYNLNESLSSILSSITTTNLDSNGSFTITPANLASGSQFQTSPSGQIYTLTAGQVEPASDSSGSTNILFLDLYTNSWQIHGKYDSTVDSGAFNVAGPTFSAAVVPEPATVLLFGAGLSGLAALRLRRKAKQV